MASSPRCFLSSCLALDQSGTDYREYNQSNICTSLYRRRIYFEISVCYFLLTFCEVVTFGLEFLRCQILPSRDYYKVLCFYHKSEQNSNTCRLRLG